MPEGAYKKAGKLLFTRACYDSMRKNGMKLEEDRFRLDVKKEIFTVWMVRHCNRLPWEVIDVSSLEAFKARCLCPWQEDWNQMTCEVPSNPTHSVIL